MPTSHACGPTDPDIAATLSLNPTGEVTVTNCSGAPAKVLLELVYATPGADLSDTNCHGGDETHITFTADAQTATCSISPLACASGDGVVGVMATAFRTTGSSPAARLLGPPIQLQAYENPGGTATTPLTADLRARLDIDLMQRNIHSPKSAGLCAIGDANFAALDNRTRDTLRGVFKAKVMCSETQGAIPETCVGNGALASHNVVVGFDAGPESCSQILSTDDAIGFNDCCDPMPAVEDPAVVSMQCSRAIMTEMNLPGLGLRVLEPFYWSIAEGATSRRLDRDIEPALGQTFPSTSVGFDCFDFAAAVPVYGTALDCFGVLPDEDNDGIFDDCDYLVPSETGEAGGESVRLRRRFRNRAFNETGPSIPPGFGTVADVLVNGESVGPFTGVPVDAIAFSAPAGLPPGAAGVTLCTNQECSPASTTAPARDPLNVRRLAFASVGGADYVRPFDEASGAFLDLDPSMDNAVPDLPATGPDGIAFTVESGNENKELLIGAGSQVFVHDLATQVLTGATLTSPVGALALDPLGKFAFALHGGTKLGVVDVRAVAGSAGRFQAISAVTTMPGSVRDLSVRRVGEGLVSDDLAVYVTGVCDNCPLDASADCGEEGGEGLMGGGGMEESSCAPYCGFEICDPEIDPNCGGGGGGGGGGTGSYRKVFVSMRILRPVFDGESNVTSWSVECSRDVRLSRLPCVEPSLCAALPPVPRLGLDLSSDGSKIYIANPQTDSLFIVDTVANDLVRDELNLPVQISVGVDPFDVEVLNVLVPSAGGFVDRAYVSNHGSTLIADDDSISIVDVEVDPENEQQWQVVGTADADEGFVLQNLEIETLAGSETTKRLFLVSGRREHILSYRVSSNGLTLLPEYKFPAGPGPRRVAAQEGAP